MKKLKFRAIEPDDIDLLFKTENDTESWFTTETEAPLSRHLLTQYALSYQAAPFEEGQLRMIAEDYDSGIVVGIADFYELSNRHRHGLIGLYILPEIRNTGYGKLMLLEMLEYAKKFLGLEQVAARVAVSNTIASRLFEHAGFSNVGTLRKWYFLNGIISDITIFQFSLI